ncbi:hypothetical protein Calkro_1578 [Caldicellulosiruptor kronotskyensis 2002]|uniref:Uncharacterized protein n=1 Tax=Caldicellulosiruptor kronotskyensis (strain DSM 18902 / VKM B-2412 / 2002) TaxID=632348 RepID=E4SFA5_CALK2|nr:hypothetical protein [Caldicellulosiruptor kronotskyensis]ADQ46430.1 hypothetical protein Calkro_1578 [Caldicellulosiruptor kronotskyensis 2002]
MKLKSKLIIHAIAAFIISLIMFFHLCISNDGFTLLAAQKYAVGKNITINKVIKGKIIHSNLIDLNGDKKNEHVIIVIDKSSESLDNDFMSETCHLAILDSKTIRLLFSVANVSDYYEGCGVEPEVKYVDITNDGITDIMIQTPSGGSNCVNYLRIIAWDKNNFQEILKYEGDDATNNNIDRSFRIEGDLIRLNGYYKAIMAVLRDSKYGKMYLLYKVGGEDDTNDFLNDLSEISYVGTGQGPLWEVRKLGNKNVLYAINDIDAGCHGNTIAGQEIYYEWDSKFNKWKLINFSIKSIKSDLHQILLSSSAAKIRKQMKDITVLKNIIKTKFAQYNFEDTTNKTLINKDIPLKITANQLIGKKVKKVKKIVLRDVTNETERSKLFVRTKNVFKDNEIKYIFSDAELDEKYSYRFEFLYIRGEWFFIGGWCNTKN